MSEALKIELSDAVSGLAAKTGDRDGMLRQIARTLDEQNQLTIAHISTVRMRGNNGKPFPVEMHVLGIRSARLIKSIRASKAQVSGSVVEGGIGSNVKYAGPHEFGARIKIPAREGTVRLRTDRSGSLMRQIGFPTLAVFARRKHKQAKEISYSAAAHDINIPARAPIRTGIQDRRPQYGTAIANAITVFWGTHE
jgi:phage gpG-like protein